MYKLAGYAMPPQQPGYQGYPPPSHAPYPGGVAQQQTAQTTVVLQQQAPTQTVQYVHE